MPKPNKNLPSKRQARGTTEAMGSMDAHALRDIARQLRDLVVETDYYAYQLDMAGNLLVDAVRRFGAFSGLEYLQFRYALEPSRYRTWGSELHIFIFRTAVGWLIRHIDHLSVQHRPTFYTDPAFVGGHYSAEYIKTNLLAVADLIEQEADKAGIGQEPEARKPVSSADSSPRQSGKAQQDADNEDDSYLTIALLAKKFNLPFDPLRTRLNRWRAVHGDGWIENPDRRPRQAKYLYHVSDIRSIIDSLRTTSERPAKK